MTFPMKNSVLDNFPPCPPAQAPLKSANFIFIVVSLSLKGKSPNLPRIFFRAKPLKTWKNQGKHPNNQGNSLLKINQGKEGQGSAPWPPKNQRFLVTRIPV